MNRTIYRSIIRRNHKLALGVIWVILLGLLILSSTGAVSADPTAVTLLYFRGTGQDNAVLLEWATGTEFNTAGFRIMRANEENGQYQVLDQIGFIPGEGDGIFGAVYEAVDEDNVSNGTVYWYKLIEFELDGRENPVGPISVTAGSAAPTATSSPIPSATATTPSGGSPATATPDPTEISATSTPTSFNPGSSGASASSATANPSGASLIPTVSGSTQTDSTASSSTTGAANPSDPGNAAAPEATLDLSGYPEPEQSENSEQTRSVRSNGAQGYPDPDPEGVPPTPASESYPLGIGERLPDLTPLSGSESTVDSAVIGSRDSADQEVENVEAESEQSGISSAILWMGFVASFLLFSAGVIGSIIYFSRQRMQGR